MPSHIFREVDRGHVSNVRKQLAVNPDALHATTASVFRRFVALEIISALYRKGRLHSTGQLHWGMET